MASPAGEHIVKSYDEELKRLTGEIQRMGQLALAELEAAMDAVVDRDTDAAERVVQMDPEIDRLEHDVSHDVVRLLALRQPMARDLREVCGLVLFSGPHRTLPAGAASDLDGR